MSIVFKHKNYITHRAKPLRYYIDQMVTYIQLYHPTIELSQIQAFVEAEVNRTIQQPKADVLYHPIPGTTKRVTTNLMTHLNNKIDQNIITPSGSVYLPTSVKESFLKVTLADKKATRSIYKKAMLTALEQGNAYAASINNFIQASTKIFLNSAPGGMGSAHNPLYDLPGYNSITSIARHGVKVGYAHVERSIEGNIHLRSINDVIDYCVILINTMPKNWNDVLISHQLHIPSIAELVEYFNSSLQYYLLVVPIDQLTDFCTKLNTQQASFIFYAGNLRNLFRFNDTKFRQFFKTLFDTNYSIDPTIDAKSIYSTESDLLNMITSIRYEYLGIDSATGGYYSIEQAIEHNPDGIRKIIYAINHITKVLQTVEDLFLAILRLDSDFTNINIQENMIRRCVIVSDTDSVIFSTQSMVEWYSDEINFKKSSYEINAFVVYLLSRSIEHVFARLSCGFGMQGSDIYSIVMKNEFLYPIMLRAPIKKHYAGISTIQEGKLLAKPKIDIKGLQFRSSTLSKLTNTEAEKFYITILHKIVSDVAISIHEIYDHVMKFELRIYKSLMDGQPTFLQTTTIKEETEYADPTTSAYFYYMLWQSVFVPEFDIIQLPNKCYKLPLLNNGNILKDPAFIEQWNTAYPQTYEKYNNFITRWPKKKITALMIAPSLSVVPEFLRAALDIRAIIHDNCQPFYLILKSLGIGLAYANHNYLVSDFHNPDITTMDLSY